MVIIFSIIAIVALVSVYDYFSAKNWQQVTSAVRNDVVFEKRNKEYGAYVIRRDYDKRMILILLGMVGSMGAAYATFEAVRSRPEMAVAAHEEEFDTIPMIIDPRREDLIIPIDKDDQAPASMQEMNKLTELVVTDDPLTEPVLAPDPDVLSGDHTQKGTDEPVFNPPFTGDKKGTGGDPVIEVKKPEGPFIDVDEEAQFPGGREKMIEFLIKNLKYPDIASQMGIGGKCYLQFVVDKQGQISSIKITRGIEDCPECGQEAARVIRKMPNWRPGKVKGEAVDSYFTMPINFAIEKD